MPTVNLIFNICFFNILLLTNIFSFFLLKQRKVTFGIYGTAEGSPIIRSKGRRKKKQIKDDRITFLMHDQI